MTLLGRVQNIQIKVQNSLQANISPIESSLKNGFGAETSQVEFTFIYNT